MADVFLINLITSMGSNHPLALCSWVNMLTNNNACLWSVYAHHHRACNIIIGANGRTDSNALVFLLFIFFNNMMIAADR